MREGGRRRIRLEVGCRKEVEEQDEAGDEKEKETAPFSLFPECVGVTQAKATKRN